jgi:hypothetical protein
MEQAHMALAYLISDSGEDALAQGRQSHSGRSQKPNSISGTKGRSPPEEGPANFRGAMQR